MTVCAEKGHSNRNWKKTNLNYLQMHNLVFCVLFVVMVTLVQQNQAFSIKRSTSPENNLDNAETELDKLNINYDEYPVSCSSHRLIVVGAFRENPLDGMRAKWRKGVSTKFTHKRNPKKTRNLQPLMAALEQMRQFTAIIST